MSIRDDIIAEARQWLGVRWQHQASVKGVACDCIGLIRGVARGVGFSDPFTTGEAQRFAGYSRNPEPAALREACAMFLVPIKPKDALLGDILVFRFERDPMHFALLSVTDDPRYMLHAHARVHKVAENRIDSVWNARIVGAHRYKELA